MRKFCQDKQELNFIDTLLLQEFKGSADKFVEKIKQSNSIDRFIRMAETTPEFENFCSTNEGLKDHWGSLWTSYGFVLSPQHHKIVFHPQPKLNNFNLVRGAYYFLQALLEDQKNLYTASSLDLLKKAIKYGSIHAMQRYNQYLYKKDDLDEEDFREIIKNNQSIVCSYGSFSYMMLAEAYYQFTLWHLKQGHLQKANTVSLMALQCCDLAQSILDKSTLATENASIGEGLKASNSEQLSSPESLKEYMVTNLFKLQLSNVHMKPAESKDLEFQRTSSSSLK